MKRNKTTKRVPTSGISPYCKKGKRPYVYPAWVTDRTKPIPVETQTELYQARENT